MPLPIIRYDLDMTGISLNNKVENEQHTLADKIVRALAPKYGAFYTESIVVRDVTNNRFLVKGVDFKCVELAQEASAAFGKEICYLIVITNTTVSSNITVTYQVLGGMYTRSADAISQYYDLIMNDNRSVNWVDVINKPDGYTPTTHLHDLKDVYGFQYLVDSLERLAKAILMRNVPAMEEITDYITSVDNKLIAYNPDWNQADGTKNDFILNKPTSASATKYGFVDNISLQELGGVDKLINGVRIGRGNGTISGNLVLGTNGLTNITTGYSNTALGNYGLYLNTTGVNNTAVGSASLYTNTTGNNNTAIGVSSLRYNTTGGGNTAAGFESLFNNTTGIINTAVGQQSLRSNTVGYYNTAIGTSSLISNIDGSFNTAVGVNSLRDNTAGNYNTALGSYSLFNNTRGNNNVGVGVNSLKSNLDGIDNVAIGANSLHYNTTGHNNVASGRDSLFNNTVGIGNTGYGKLSLSGNTSGNFNTAIGYNANSITSIGTNNIVIGANASPTTSSVSNEVTIGDVNITNTRIRGAISVGNTTPDPGAFGRVLQSNGALVAPTWTNTPTLTGTNFTGIPNNAFINNSITIGNTPVALGGTITNLTGMGSISGNGAFSTTSNISSGGNLTVAGTSTLTGNVTAGGALAVAGGTTIGGNVSISGTLTVSGGTTTINSQVTLEDPMIYLGDDNPADVVDAGFVSSYTNGGYKHTGFVRDASDGIWKLFNNVIPEPTAVVDFTNATYSTLKVGDILTPTINGIEIGHGNNNIGNNVSFGNGSLKNNTTGQGNISLGVASLFSNTTGNWNVSIGHSPLSQNTTGYDNVAVGTQALNLNTIGHGNIGIGRWAGFYITTGVGNTVIGDTSGNNLTTGSNNIVIGNTAQPSSATVNNEVTIGNTSVTNTRIRGAISVGNTTPNPGIDGEIMVSKGPLVAPKWTSFNLQNNLEPEAGFGMENTVPMSSVYPNTLNAYNPTQTAWIDKEGQKVIFFTSVSAYGTRRMARARLLDGKTIVDDSNIKFAGYDIPVILNGSRVSMCLQTSNNKVYVFNPNSSSNFSDWVMVTEVTNVHNALPNGATGGITVSSFHYSPEFNKIIRLCVVDNIKVYVQILDTSANVLSTALVLNVSTLIDYTGGLTPTDGFGLIGYSDAIRFAYSFEKKEIIFKSGGYYHAYKFTDGATRYRTTAVNLSVPDLVFINNNASLITNKIPYYKFNTSIGDGSNGVTGENAGYAINIAWDPILKTYIENIVYFVPTDLGSVNWNISTPSLAWSFGTWYNLPDVTHIGKNVYGGSIGFLIGSNNILAYGLSQKYGAKFINIPFNGYTAIEGNNCFNPQLSKITEVGDFSRTYYDGSTNTWRRCEGAGLPIKTYSETVTGWTSQASTDVQIANPAGYTLVINPLYVKSQNFYIALAYKNSDSRHYLYLIKYGSTTVELASMLHADEVDEYFNGTNGRLNSFEEGSLAWIDDHLFVISGYSAIGGLYQASIRVYNKSDVINATANITPVKTATSMPYFGSVGFGKTPDGKVYRARATYSPNIVTITEYWNNSTEYANGTAAYYRADLTVATTEGLGLFISSYPLFVGGSQRTIAATTLALTPNKTTYVIASASPDDSVSVIISTVDYLPAGQSSTFNSHNQVCICEATTGNEKILTKTDFTIRRDAQKLTYNSGILSLSRSNTIDISQSIDTLTDAYKYGTNIHLGINATAANSTFGHNTSLGVNAFNTTSTSTGNTAIGYEAIGQTTGGGNTAVGSSALVGNTTGGYNTAIGLQAGYTTTTGVNNILIGYNATASSSVVSNEITLGNSSITALRIPGLDYIVDKNGTYHNTTTWHWNRYAGGSGHAIQFYDGKDPDEGIYTYTYQTDGGYFTWSMSTSPTAWDYGVVKLSLNHNGYLTAQGDITAFSDERFKTDWVRLPDDFLTRLTQVKVGTFTRTDTGVKQAGSSAQDWQKLLPEVVNVDEKTGNLSLAYGNAALVSVIELAKKTQSLEAQNSDLKARLEKLETLVNELMNK